MSALKRLSCYRIPDHRIARNLFAHGRAFPLPLKFALLAAALSLLMPAWSAIRSEGFRSASLKKSDTCRKTACLLAFRHCPDSE
jgi:hypothetical protein